MTPYRPSRTAEAVCFMRALEQVRPAEARILDDPYAEWFLSAPTRSVLELARGAVDAGLPIVPLAGMSTYVQTRHRYMDDRLVEALGGGTVGQVVVLGAGYDMRAWRFAAEIGARPVFEVDYPSTAARKARILAARGATPPVDLHRRSIDFQSERLEDVLPAGGFVRGMPTFFFWEGVSMYLTREAVEATLTTLRALGGPGSALVMDFWHVEGGRTAAVHRVGERLLRLLSEPIHFALPPVEAPAFLGGLGWTVQEVADAAELRRRYVRDGRAPGTGTYCVYATV